MCVELSTSAAAVCFLQDAIGGGCVVAFLLRLLWFVVRQRCWVAGRWWCLSGASGDEVSPPAACEERWWSLLRPRLAVTCDGAHSCGGVPVTLHLVRLYGLCTR